MHFGPKRKKLPAFQERLQTGLCLYHQGGGVYQVLTREGVLRTKHVRAEEQKFPGLSVFGRKDSESESENEAVVDVSPHLDRDGINSEVDPLTYVPEKPSTHGVSSEDDDDLLEDANDDSSSDSESSTEEPQQGRYNLRHREPVDYAECATTSVYACLAQSDTIRESDEPKLRVALQSDERPEWEQGIREEFQTLQDNDTFEVVDKVPPGVQVLPSNIILKIKRDSDGNAARYKARVVVLGNLQSVPVTLLELYAPVACIELVRVMLTIAVSLGWEIHQVDIKGAFLHATLPKADNIYVRFPKMDCIPSLSGRVVKLLKSLYGLRQAPKLWYEHLSRELAKRGFRRSMSSECLFTADLPTGPAYIVVYVDDLLIFGSATTVVVLKKMLSELFTVTDLGKCQYFLGIKIQRTQKGLFLSQGAYIERIIRGAGMESAKPATTPLPLGHRHYEIPKPLTEEEKQMMKNKPYREVLGALIYLSTRTRPDISTAVSMLGRFQADPGPVHWKHLQHLVRYLIGTSSHGLLLKSQKGRPKFDVYSDADWAREEEKRRSRSGYVLLLNSSPVIWSSKLQTATAQSTAEAEFIALSACLREVCWVRSILDELGLSPE